MLPTNRSLLALALCALCGAPAFAGDKPPTKASQPGATTSTTTTTTPATSAQSSDAVSARATAREAGRMKEPLVGANAQAQAKTNPGKGNWWADADIDGDGQLSAAEAKAQAGLDAVFGNVDADGFVTNDEYRKYYTGGKSRGEVNATAHSTVVARDVFKLDANRDGKLSSSEASTNNTVSGAFAAMDSNGDGFVTQAEYQAYAKANLKK